MKWMILLSLPLLASCDCRKYLEAKTDYKVKCGDEVVRVVAEDFYVTKSGLNVVFYKGNREVATFPTPLCIVTEYHNE